MQSHSSGITFGEIFLSVVNQEGTVIESISRWINLKPKFHTKRRRWWTAPSSTILLEAIPICNEKPNIQAPKLLRNSLPTPANLGLPKELSSMFNFIKGSSRAFHLIILGIPILIFFAGQTRKKNFVAHWTTLYIIRYWEKDWLLKIHSFLANYKCQQRKGK